MFRYFVGACLLFAGSLNVFSQNENPECENYYIKDSDKPHVLCDYDFGREKIKVLISKECISKKCEAYKAYERALTIVIDPDSDNMDQNWGTINCRNLNGISTYLSPNRQRSGEMHFCKFNDSSFILTGFLDTSRIN